MIEPLHIAFDVAVPSEHAFQVWTGQIGRWWPADHTTTGEADLTVSLEPRPGGRIYERTADGREFDWGEVLIWEPPARFVYSWHLRRSRKDATEVEIRFVATGPAVTRVEIEHRGWERLGAEGQTWRDRNHGGWTSLLPHYVAALTAPKPERMNDMATGTGTREDPWQLTTPPGTSAYQMWRDDTVDPPVILCQVGGTQLKYDARAIEELHAWLKEQGDWVPLGGADEQKAAPDGSVEAWGRSESNPRGGWYGLKKGLRGRFGVYMPPLLEALGLAEVTHDPKGNRMRAL